MSRTYKTRPMWVQNNDPQRVPYRSRHDHCVTLSELVGYEEYEPYWAPGTVRQQPLYHRWTEPVPCTLDVPEKTTSSWRFKHPRKETNEDRLSAKHCDTKLLWYSETWRSKRDLKCLTNRALRSKINQQLHQAVTTNNYGDAADWWDVDINADTKYANYMWWD